MDDKPSLNLALVERNSKLQTHIQHFAGKAMQVKPGQKVGSDVEDFEVRWD